MTRYEELGLKEADELLEGVGADPFGLNVMLEGSLDSLNPDDLLSKEGINDLKGKIKKVNNIKLALKIWSKLSWLAVAGGVAGGVASGTGDGLTTGGILSLISLISGRISSMVAKHMHNKQESELIYISKTLGTSIERLKRKVSSISDEKTREAIEDQISNAENLKNQVDTVLQSNKIERDRNRTTAINRVGTATFVS